MKRETILRNVTAALVCVLVAVGVAACGGGSESENAAKAEGNAALTNDVALSNHQLAILQKAEPPAEPRDSADLRVQNTFYTAEADPNKIWYLETLSYTGNVEASYTIRGPVVSANDEVTNPEQERCHHSENGSDGDALACATIGLAEPNGTYERGSNDHLAILADGALLRFEGNYQTSDQPFVIKAPESISVNASAPISETNTSLSAHPYVPKRGG